MAVVLSLLSGVILYFVSEVNYLFFHALVEGFAILCAALIYVLGTKTYHHSKNDSFLFLGIAYLHVAILDFMHTLTYKGMGVFPAFDSDAPTQLWIAGRFLETISLFLVIFIAHRKINRKAVGAVYTAVTTGFLITIMVYPVFPACFVEGQGLTTFKIWNEYAFIALLLGGAYALYMRRDRVMAGSWKVISLAMIITALSELAFTLYTDVYGISNAVGHLLKVASYYVIFEGIMIQGIEEPYSLIASELKEMAWTDALTGQFNRQGMLEEMAKHWPEMTEADKGMGLLVLDLDNFKSINDRYGHLYGDEVLKAFSERLAETVRDNDIACRFGGDEFVVVLRGVDFNKMMRIQGRIQTALDEWIRTSERLQGLGVSIGSAFLAAGDSLDMDRLLREADTSMYAVKESKKRAAQDQTLLTSP